MASPQMPPWLIHALILAFDRKDKKLIRQLNHSYFSTVRPLYAPQENGGNRLNE